MYLKDFKSFHLDDEKDLESALSMIAAKIHAWISEWRAAPSTCLAGGASKCLGFGWAQRLKCALDPVYFLSDVDYLHSDT